MVKGIHAVLIFLGSAVVFMLLASLFRASWMEELETERRQEILILTALGDPDATEYAGSYIPHIFNKMREGFDDSRYHASTVSEFIEWSDSRTYPMLLSFVSDEEVTDFYWYLHGLNKLDREQLLRLDSYDSGLANGWSLTYVLQLPQTKGTEVLLASERARHSIPSEPSFFAFDSWWLGAYLTYCGVFSLLALVIFLNFPTIRWRDFGVITVMVLVFPASFIFTAVIFTYWLLKAIFNRQLHPIQRFSAAIRTMLTTSARLLYRVRILRRLPAPILQPTVRTSAITPEAEPEPAESMPNDEQSTEPIDLPQWFVFDPELILGRRAVLSQEGIGVYPLLIRSPKVANMLAVQGTDIERFERLLHLTSTYEVECTDKATDIESTVYRSYERSIGEIELHRLTESEYDESVDVSPEMEEVIEAVSLAVGGLDIKLVQGIYCPVEETDHEEKFVILYEFAPERNAETRQYEFCLEDGSVKVLDGFAPASNAENIFSDEGRELGQLIGNTVVVLFPLLELGSAGQELLANTLIQAAEMWHEFETSDDTVKARRWKELIDSHARNYIELRMKSIGLRKTELTNGIKEREIEIQEAEQQIVRSVREQHAMRDDLRRLETRQLDEERRRINTEFEQLAASPNIVSVRATADVVYVETRTVYINSGGRKYEIGRFRIALHDDGRVRFKNVSSTAGRFDGHHHPHVFGDGSACFGNISGAIGKLMANREYAAVVAVLFRFLESVNTSSTVNRISHWKVVEE